MRKAALLKFSVVLLVLVSIVSISELLTFRSQARENVFNNEVSKFEAQLNQQESSENTFIAKVKASDSQEFIDENSDITSENSLVDLGKDYVYTVVKSNDDKSLAKQMAEFKQKEEVLDVYPNIKFEPSWSAPVDGKTYPSDFNSTNLWYLDRTKVPETWALQECNIPESTECGGSSEIVLAVIDDGVSYENYNATYIDETGATFNKSFGKSPSLDTNDLWVNPGETLNNIDDDNNGICDDMHGVDFGQVQANIYAGIRDDWNEDCDYPSDAFIEGAFLKEGHPNTDHGHGNFIASLIGSTIDNGSNNELGMAHNIKIMPFKTALPHERLLDLFAVVNSIIYATENGADVINMSFGSSTDTSLLRDVIEYAYSQGVVLVASTGNNSLSSLSFPARYPQVISVGSSTVASTRASYSNYGTGINLLAPSDSGGAGFGNYAETLTCFYNANCSSASDLTSFQTAYSSGTSFAAPQVAATAALLKGLNPSYGVEDIRSTINASAADILPEGPDNFSGAGVLDVYSSYRNVFSDFEDSSGPINTEIKSYVYNNYLYQFSSTIADPNRVIYRSSSDGVFDTDCQSDPSNIECWRIPSIFGRTRTQASLAEYNGYLYVAVRGASTRQVFTARMSESGGVETWDSAGWIDAGGGTGAAIEMETFDPDGAGAEPERLYQSIKGGSTNSVYTRYTIDGSFDNSVPAENWFKLLTKNNIAQSTHGPSMEVFNSRLYIAVRGNDGRVYTASSQDGTFDYSETGEEFFTSAGSTSRAPTMVAYGDTLYQSIRGNGSTRVYTRMTTDKTPTNGINWGAWFTTAGQSNERVDIVEFNEKLYQYTYESDLSVKYRRTAFE